LLQWYLQEQTNYHKKVFFDSVKMHLRRWSQKRLM
jgi:hypothetical protein